MGWWRWWWYCDSNDGGTWIATLFLKPMRNAGSCFVWGALSLLFRQLLGWTECVNNNICWSKNGENARESYAAAQRRRQQQRWQATIFSFTIEETSREWERNPNREIENARERWTTKMRRENCCKKKNKHGRRTPGGYRSCLWWHVGRSCQLLLSLRSISG